MRRRFIANPNAARGAMGGALARVERFFLDRTGAFDCAVARCREEAIDRTHQALREGIEQVVAIGGDGTMNAVLNAFAAQDEPTRSRACLAVAPMGTGADYFRSIAAGAGQADWREIILRPRVAAVDVGRAVFPATGRTVYFANALGAGVSAVVAGQKQSLPRWVPNGMAYFLPMLGQLARSRAWAAKVTAGGAAFELDLLAAVVAKGRFAGGGIRVGDSALDDGQFNLAIVPRMGFVGMARALGQLYRSGLGGVSAVRTVRANGLVIDGPLPIPVELDGEGGGTTPIEIGIVPRAVRVCFPAA